MLGIAWSFKWLTFGQALIPTDSEACGMVSDKVFRMVWIVVGHQKELADGHRAERQHGTAQLTQGLSLQHHAPQVNAIPGLVEIG